MHRSSNMFGVLTSVMIAQVRLLLELGADPQRRNHEGLIAKDVALGITKGPLGAGPHNYRDDPGASEILQLLDGGSTRRDSR